MKRQHIICLLLIVSTSLFLLHGPLVNAQAEMAWGTPLNVTQSIAVSNNAEIPQGEWGWVINKEVGSVTVSGSQWEQMMSGDLSSVAKQIEVSIPGTSPTWIQISWTSVTYDSSTGDYTVTGFIIQAIVKNNSAGQTGLEIVAVIMAVAFLVALLVLISMAAWLTVQIVHATQQLGPIATIIVGLLILGGIAFLIYTLIGGRIGYKSKNREISTGRSKWGE
jgi:hypothetical protein